MATIPGRSVLALLLLYPLLVSAQVFTIDPKEPKVGDHLQMRYNGQDPSAALRGVSVLKTEMLMLLQNDPPVLQSVTMRKSGSLWSGSLDLMDSRARLLLFRVVSGDEQDNNGGNAWCVMVYGKDGSPLPGANSARASFLSGSGYMEFKHEKDFVSAKAALDLEKRLHPDYWQAYPAEWTLLLKENRSEETKKQIVPALEAFYRRFKGNEEAVAAALLWFDQTGQHERGDSIAKAAIAAHPKGRVAELSAQREISAERDPARRVSLIEKFLQEFPQKGAALDNMQGVLANSCLQAQDPERALRVLENMANPNPNMLNGIAWNWIEKGENLEQAVKVAKKAVDLATHPSVEAKPTYLSDEKWKEQMDYSRGMALDTYGFGLYKLGDSLRAEEAFAAAYQATKGEEPEITERLMMAYIRNGKFSEAMKTGREAVEAGKTSDKILAEYREAYVKGQGSGEGFDAALAEAKAVGARLMKAKLVKSRMNKPAITFALRDLDGKTVRLSDLHGKVVVIDFWATWCSPCRMSFPTLQKVLDRYRENPLVAIYALDTWEHVAGKQREDLVKKFLKDNNYTFHVLYDEGMVDRYGVEGIPTKFIIDKKGNLAFKSVGFNGADEMMNELTAQIDLLLAE